MKAHDIPVRRLHQELARRLCASAFAVLALTGPATVSATGAHADTPPPPWELNGAGNVGATRSLAVHRPGVPADFDGDGSADVSVFRPNGGVWYTPSFATAYGATGDMPLPYDFDGDGKADVAVYRPSTGLWAVHRSSDGTDAFTTYGGIAGDVPVPADFDGDGLVDVAIYRPSTGTWFVHRSSDGADVATTYGGVGGDVAVPADYDGDGKADLTIFRAGSWFVHRSSDNVDLATGWGASGDLPVPADYDGDGRTDPAIYRPATGLWALDGSGGTQTAETYGGLPGDVPVPADHDGDGKADITVFRPSLGGWYTQRSSDNADSVTTFGISGDLALPPPAIVPSSGGLTAVSGSACGYITNVGLFGGDQARMGCAPQIGTSFLHPSADSLSPSVALPGDGSGGDLTLTDPDGARAMYGPAAIFGGIWPDSQSSDPPSGPITVSASGSPAQGSVSTSADIVLNSPPSSTDPGGFGPAPVEGDELHVACTATANGPVGSTRFVNGVLTTTTDSGGAPLTTERIPDNPPVNYTRGGVITNVGDVFSVVFNQQIPNPDGSLTINAAHMYLFGPTAVGEVIKGQATCGATPSPPALPDTVPPTCGIPDVETVSPTDMTPKSPRTELVGTFDAQGLQSIQNIQVTNGDVQVGNPSSNETYLQFVPGQTGPLAVTATRSQDAETNHLPMYWSFDAVDAAGNVSHCRGAQSPPVANPDTYSTTENVPLLVPPPGVLANDTDAEGDALTAGSASTPAHGQVVLNSNGSFAYIPTPLFTGVDTFTYQLSDGYGTATGTVTITVSPPPVS